MEGFRFPLGRLHFQTFFIDSRQQLSFIAIGRSLKELDKSKASKGTYKSPGSQGKSECWPLPLVFPLWTKVVPI